MLNRLFIPIFLLFFCKAHSQSFNAGLDIGLTSSQISGDGFYGFGQFGITGGAFIQYPISDNWSVALNFCWNSKGARKYLSSSNSVSYRLRANYIDLPLTVSYYWNNFIFFGGPSINVFVNHRELINNLPSSPERPFKSLEWAIVGGIGYQINDHMTVNGIFNNSILPVRDHLNPGAYPTPRFVLGSFHQNILNKGQYFTSLSIKLIYYFRPI